MSDTWSEATVDNHKLHWLPGWSLLSMIWGGLRAREVERMSQYTILNKEEQLKAKWKWACCRYMDYFDEVSPGDIMVLFAHYLHPKIYENQEILDKFIEMLDIGCKLVIVVGGHDYNNDEDFDESAFAKRVIATHKDDVKFLRSEKMPEIHSQGVIREGGKYCLIALEQKHSIGAMPLTMDYGPFMADEIEAARRDYEKARSSSYLIEVQWECC